MRPTSLTHRATVFVGNAEWITSSTHQHRLEVPEAADLSPPTVSHGGADFVPNYCIGFVVMIMRDLSLPYHHLQSRQLLDEYTLEYTLRHGSANGLPQPRMELAERSHEQTYLGWHC